MSVTVHTGRYYVKDKKGRLQNAPYVDNSYKWAGGGLVSTAGDLVRFGDAMLYSFQRRRDDVTSLAGYLQRDTVRQLWAPVSGTRCSWDASASAYGLGWGVMRDVATYDRRRSFYVSHTGGAIGASSVLLVRPAPDDEHASAPRGVTVAIIMNMQGVNLNPLALKVASLFEEMRLHQTSAADINGSCHRQPSTATVSGSRQW